MYAKPVKPGASLSFVETPYRRQTLSYVLAFSPRLCDVLLDVEGEASVPRVIILSEQWTQLPKSHLPS